jgi:hypothetical protein
MSIFEQLHHKKPIFAPFWRKGEAETIIIVYAICSYR